MSIPNPPRKYSREGQKAFCGDSQNTCKLDKIRVLNKDDRYIKRFKSSHLYCLNGKQAIVPGVFLHPGFILKSYTYE